MQKQTASQLAVYRSAVGKIYNNPIFPGLFNPRPSRAMLKETAKKELRE